LILATCVAATALSSGAFAQKPAATAPAPQSATTATQSTAVPEGGMPTWIKPETPEHRRERLGTAEDPGINPDSGKHWWRFGKEFTIERYERKWAAYDREEGTVRPFAMVNIAWEIYQHNERFVWVWMPVEEKAPVVETPEPAPPAQSRLLAGDIAFLEKSRSQFAELSPAKNNTVIRFEESSEGLPIQGSWRNSLAVADMNGDGFVDILAPPQRGATTNAIPSIFLGDGKGHWKYWAEVSWPHGIDYGSAVAADFNKDGQMDAAFSVHLNGIYIFLGDGKGKFTEVTEGVPHDYGTRRLMAIDVNNDGYPDLAATNEGPSVRGPETTPHGKAIVLLNKNKGKAWEAIDIAGPGVRTGADWMSAGNFNGDGTPDFFLGSIYYGSWDVLFLSKGQRAWAPYPSNGDIVPSRAYYTASTSGKFSSKTRDDAIVSFFRTWPAELDPRIVPKPSLEQMIEIDRMTFGKDGLQRIPIVRWGGNQVVPGLGAGDFNGDGKLDIIYTRIRPAGGAASEAVILLGDGKGGFTQSTVSGLPILEQSTYDIRVADVNRDGKPDVILMYESGAKTAFALQDGSIHVYLNRGTTSEPATAKATEKK
jgi:hypothetical protein